MGIDQGVSHGISNHAHPYGCLGHPIHECQRFDIWIDHYFHDHPILQTASSVQLSPRLAQ